jgi:hypothetical protein
LGSDNLADLGSQANLIWEVNLADLGSQANLIWEVKRILDRQQQQSPTTANGCQQRIYSGVCV